MRYAVLFAASAIWLQPLPISAQAAAPIFDPRTLAADPQPAPEAPAVPRSATDPLSLVPDYRPKPAAPKTPAPGQPSPSTANSPAVPGTDTAYAALRVRDYPLAISAFTRTLAADPTLTSVRKDLAYTYLKIGENELALEQFREVMHADPSDAQAALDYAFLCYETRRPGEARRTFDRLRKSGNATAEQAFRNIDSPLVSGIARWKQAIELGAYDFSTHFELATLAEQRDDFSLAAEHYEKAWRVLPDRRSVLVALGRVLLALGRTEDATAALLAASRGGEPRAAEQARELLPTRYPYVPEFRRALALDPGNTELRRELAFLFLRMNRQAEAEAEFRMVVERVPGDLLAATQLGFLLHARGEEAAAKPLFDRVLAGNDPELANRVRAVLHIQQAPEQTTPKEMAARSLKAGYLNDALRYLQAAHETDPSDPEVLFKLGWTNNMLHRDRAAFAWFDQARKSGDPAIAREAEKSWRNLRPSFQRVRISGWMYPVFSTRWHDLFSYAQFKTELRTGLGFRTYISARVVGDTRQTIGALVPQYLSESSIILAAGVSAGPWHGFTLWGEAGSAYSYLTRHALPDYRGGLSVARGVGHSLHAESPGPFAALTVDALFLSRFGNEALAYNQLRAGYTIGPRVFRTQLYAVGNAVVDARRQEWANFGEAGLGLRIGGLFLPQSMYFTAEAMRGRYFLNRAWFSDLRAGVWYAFSH